MLTLRIFQMKKSRIMQEIKKNCQRNERKKKKNKEDKDK